MEPGGTNSSLLVVKLFFVPKFILIIRDMKKSRKIQIISSH